MSNKTSDKNVVTEEDIEVLEERLFFYENSKKIGTVNKMIPQAVKENEAIKHLLAEQDQKDKRIKELEADLYSANEIIADLTDSIPKQVVIDKIEELENDIKLGNCRYPYILEHKIDVLQELLEGESKWII